MFKNQRGNGLLLVIVVFAALFGVIGISLTRSKEQVVQVQKRYLEDAALNLAEAGVEYAIYKLQQAGPDYYGKESVSLETGGFFTSVFPLADPAMIEIRSTGIAKSPGQLRDIIKNLRVVVRLNQNDPEHPLGLYSREDVP